MLGPLLGAEQREEEHTPQNCKRRVFRLGMKGVLHVVNYPILKLLFFQSYDMAWFI